MSAISGGLLAVYVAVSLLFFARSTTFGKNQRGLRVVRSDGRGAGLWTNLTREWIVRVISGAALFLGSAWILIDRENQDRIGYRNIRKWGWLISRHAAVQAEFSKE